LEIKINSRLARGRPTLPLGLVGLEGPNTFIFRLRSDAVGFFPAVEQTTNNHQLTYDGGYWVLELDNI